ncbi:uncharacterized protein A4U43_C09F8690 [Asparagus officinalis]|uniref:Uncharacterized protein n=1 Tax=Asparagus officinalis TaxID=4686 RepID=A0A5P1EB44_ASPOF|nr:uncharacterized protein A4U43_C09F8690 [Asparagus officinalis]
MSGPHPEPLMLASSSPIKQSSPNEGKNLLDVAEPHLIRRSLLDDEQEPVRLLHLQSHRLTMIGSSRVDGSSGNVNSGVGRSGTLLPLENEYLIFGGHFEFEEERR